MRHKDLVLCIVVTLTSICFCSACTANKRIVADSESKLEQVPRAPVQREPSKEHSGKCQALQEMRATEKTKKDFPWKPVFNALIEAADWASTLMISNDIWQ